VLRDVTLSLPPGRVTEVTGPNGAGKSTFLRLAAGLRTPRRGKITGRPAKVGYAPERFPSDQPFTVHAYLTHMAAIQKAPRTAIATWAERLAFDHLLSTRLPELSKGSAQKVGLAQALLSAPDLLILDEPFAGLDAATRGFLPGVITELAAQGTTVVVSDHQRCLEAVPDRAHVHISRGAARHVPSGDSGADRSTPDEEPVPDERTPDTRDVDMRDVDTRDVQADRGAWTVLEVVVRADEVTEVIGKLRAEGLDVRDPGR
jgi:ABC-type uncharacterized transport system ATPase subunit